MLGIMRCQGVIPVPARDVFGEQEAFGERKIHGVIPAENRLIAALGMTGGGVAGFARLRQFGTGFDSGQLVQQIGGMRGRSHKVSLASSGRGEVTVFGVRRTQPNAGATWRAISSMERKMYGCGGSMECTWKARSVTRASALSCLREVMTCSGEPRCTSNARM